MSDGRAGYQDYIHNLDKLTVYIDSSSQRPPGNYYTRRSYVAGGSSSSSSGRRSVVGGSKRAAGSSSVVVDGRREQHHHQRVDATLCGVKTRAAVATAAGPAQPDVRNRRVQRFVCRETSRGTVGRDAEGVEGKGNGEGVFFSPGDRGLRERRLSILKRLGFDCDAIFNRF